MKTLWTGLALLAFSGFAMAQVGELYDARVIEKTTISDPAKVAGDVEDQWFAFSMPVTEGTRSPCCWKGKWTGMGEVGCSLERRHESYGTRSNSPVAQNVIVFSEVRGGKIHSLRVVGEQCPVEGNGVEVTWIGSVEENAGLDWLEAVARSGGRDSFGDGALWALALHRSPAASQRLYAMALDTDDDLFEEAMFWLGEARGEKGSQILFDIARNKQAPRKARRQAIFWLANSDNDSTVAALTELLTR